MTAIVRIDPDGTVTRVVGKVLPSDIDGSGIEIVTAMRCPCPKEHVPLPTLPIGAPESLVIAVKDFGRRDGEPINLKAWALYARSPIVGPVLVCWDLDDDGYRGDLTDEWIERMSGQVDWLEPEVAVRMAGIAQAEQLTWPDGVEDVLMSRIAAFVADGLANGSISEV